MWIKYQIHRSDWFRKFRQGSTCNVSLISFDSHLDNKDVTIHSMTPYPSYMLVSLRSKLFEFSLTGSFLECLRQRQKVVIHIPRVYISWRPPYPTESSTTSCRLFQGPQNHWMGTISHTTTCLAIPTHLICQFACIQSTFHSMKAHNRRIKSRSGDGSRHLGMWWTIVFHISWSTVDSLCYLGTCRVRMKMTGQRCQAAHFVNPAWSWYTASSNRFRKISNRNPFGINECVWGLAPYDQMVCRSGCHSNYSKYESTLEDLLNDQCYHFYARNIDIKPD